MVEGRGRVGDGWSKVLMLGTLRSVQKKAWMKVLTAVGSNAIVSRVVWGLRTMGTDPDRSRTPFACSGWFLLLED